MLMMKRVDDHPGSKEEELASFGLSWEDAARANHPAERPATGDLHAAQDLPEAA